MKLSNYYLNWSKQPNQSRKKQVLLWVLRRGIMNNSPLFIGKRVDLLMRLPSWSDMKNRQKRRALTDDSQSHTILPPLLCDPLQKDCYTIFLLFRQYAWSLKSIFRGFSKTIKPPLYELISIFTVNNRKWGCMLN